MSATGIPTPRPTSKPVSSTGFWHALMSLSLPLQSYEVDEDLDEDDDVALSTKLMVGEGGILIGGNERN